MSDAQDRIPTEQEQLADFIWNLLPDPEHVDAQDLVKTANTVAAAILEQWHLESIDWDDRSEA